jgi:acid phosphatase type 7
MGLKKVYPLLGVFVFLLSSCVLFAKDSNENQEVHTSPTFADGTLSTLYPTITILPLTPTYTPLPPTPAPTRTPAPVILAGAGDISICGQEGDTQTASLLEHIPGEVFTAGDNSNEDGLMSEYQKCFGKTWGKFIARIHPSPGNHDYQTPGAVDYFSYFGNAAGEPGKGYYSYDFGSWHILSLNGNCSEVACGPTSPQVKWLKEDLATHPAQCVLAYWHQPRWSSGETHGDGRVSILWKTLYGAGADVVINGHEHHYERFKPLGPEGEPDMQRGMREFIVGTGGASLVETSSIATGSEVRQSKTFGVLKLELYSGFYRWEFIPVAGQNFKDSGQTNCH